MVKLAEVINEVTSSFPNCSVKHDSMQSRDSEWITVRKEKGSEWYEAVLEVWGLPSLTHEEITEAISGFKRELMGELEKRGLM